ncbi:hypothetical protein ACIGHN_27425 [Acidovorax sp. NPDC077693]|uniref:hypothetical protein n=1 Tax=unclassified Acidovorax TaxID=2684926 RepID=UPI0037CC58FD
MELIPRTLHLLIGFQSEPCPWQRDSNEKINDQARECLHRRMDLSQISHQQLTALEQMLNHRSRKMLNFHCPHEVFPQLTADLIAGVALHV